jgi:TolB protein
VRPLALVLVLLVAGLASRTPHVAAAEPVRLTDDGLVKRDPVVWPGGKEIVYCVEQPSGRMKLVRRPLGDPSAAALVHPGENISDRELSVSADGAVYAYNSITGGKGIDSVILVARSDGSKTVAAPVKGWSHWPHLSPDGRRVVFSENAQRVYRWEVDFDAAPEAQPDDKSKGKGEKPKEGQDPKSLALKSGALKLLAGDGFWPRWSPDGRRIVFATARDGDLEIYVMDADGSNQTRLTRSPGLDTFPAWSPDGTRIAFVSRRDGNPDLYVMRADGTDVRRLTEHPERDEQPAWHPDGRRLVFVGERDGAFDLYLVEVPQ